MRPLALWFNRSAPLALRSDISPGLVGLRPGSVGPLGIPLDDDTTDVQDARQYRQFENLGTRFVLADARDGTAVDVMGNAAALPITSTDMAAATDSVFCSMISGGRSGHASN